MPDPYTYVSKPTSSLYSAVYYEGKQIYDQSDIAYDESSIYYDSVNPVAYTSVAKPTSSTYTMVSKPTS